MPRSVVGRVGRWCSRHWAWVLIVWTAAVIAGGMAVGPLFSKLSDGGAPNSVESVAVNSVLNTGNPTGGVIYGLVAHVDPHSPAVQAAANAASDRLLLVPNVAQVVEPFAPVLPAAQAARLLSPQGDGFMVTVTLSNVDRSTRDTAAVAIRDQLHALAADLPPGATVEVGGSPVLSLDRPPTGRARTCPGPRYSSLPVTLIVLVFVFGGLLAAGLPVITAAVSVAAAMVVLLGFSTFTDVDPNAVTVVTLLGLGLSSTTDCCWSPATGRSCWPAARRTWRSPGPGQRPAGPSCSAR